MKQLMKLIFVTVEASLSLSNLSLNCVCSGQKNSFQILIFGSIFQILK